MDRQCCEFEYARRGPQATRSSTVPPSSAGAQAFSELWTNQGLVGNRQGIGKAAGSRAPIMRMTPFESVTSGFYADVAVIQLADAGTTCQRNRPGYRQTPADPG